MAITTTTAQKFLLADSSTNADFWNWGKGISDFIAAAGYTKTADSGQVVWNTTNAPTANNYVYEVWQSTDTLNSGSFPYYIKVMYGTGSANSVPNLQIYVLSKPTTSNGTLDPTGNNLGPFVLQSNMTTAEASPTTSTFECDFAGSTSSNTGNTAGGGGFLCFLMWRNAAASAYRPCFFAIERSQNSSGVYTNGYVTVLSAGANAVSTSVVQQQTLYNPSPNNLTFTVTQAAFATVFSPLASLLSQNTTPMLPIVPLIGQVDNPLTVAGVAKNGDQVEGSTSTANMYGTTITYIFSTKNNFQSLGTGTSNHGIMMRYS